MKNYLLTALAVAIVGGGGYGIGTLLDPNQEIIPRSEIVAQDFGETVVLSDGVTTTRTDNGVEASFMMRVLQGDHTVDGLEYLLADVVEKRTWDTKYILDCVEEKNVADCESQISFEIAQWKDQTLEREKAHRIVIQDQLVEEDRAAVNSVIIDNFL